MKTKMSLLILSLVLLGACGKEDKEDRKDTEATEQNPTQDPASGSDDLIQDEAVAGQAITAQLDEGISAAVEENDDDASASLALGTAEGQVTRFRECTEDGAHAVVDLRREAERTLSAEGPIRKLDTTFSAYYEKQRTWSKEGAEIKCGEQKKAAALPVADMAGVKLDVTFKHERNRKTTLVNKKKNETFERSMAYTVEGERHASWTEVKTEGASLLIRKEVTGTSTRKLEVTKKDGSQLSLEASVANAEGQPLQILVERDKDTLTVLSRTIVAGKRVATNKDGSRIEITWDNVKYSADKRCTAVSGKISGEIYKKDEAAPALTFEIVFDGGDKTVTLSNGKEFDYSPEGCDLDETAAATEVDSKDEVKPAP